ncbi:hypothetical protein Sste5346_009258 [Sporothrix stenoceras]|uniref:DUF3533 domain-containing protein n=1 Tax=Sporothrix stenoceras TaxID=5173 RepID=A0ABR3YNA7_9PEZI
MPLADMEANKEERLEAAQPVEIDRKRLLHPYWHGRRKAFIIPKIMMGLIIIIAFLLIMSNFFGSASEQAKRVKALKVLVVDYDDGVIGTSFANAYNQLKADSFPTVEFRSASQFPTTESVHDAVCRGGYWAGAYVPSGASSRLSAALKGGAAAEDYSESPAFTYIYNQARYPTVADGVLLGGLTEWVSAARAAYYQTGNGTTLATINQTDAASVAAYLDPITSAADIIMPTTQGARVYYDTAYMVPPCLAPFFLILAMNGISGLHDVFARAYVRDVAVLRFVIGKIYTFLASLAFAGYLWGFRESWQVGGREFVLTWMVMWLDLEVNWVIMESLVASFIPLAFVSVFVVSWVMVNVASAVFPFELSAGWYRWGYCLPAHNTYVTLVYVWSRCASPLRYSLPIMFSWWVVGHVVAWFSILKRCRDAEKQLKASLESRGGDTAN